MNKKLLTIIIALVFVLGAGFMFYFLFASSDDCVQPTITISPESPYENEEFTINSSVTDAEANYEWFLDGTAMLDASGNLISGPSGKIKIEEAGKHQIKIVINGSCESALEITVRSRNDNMDAVKVDINGPKQVELGKEAEYSAEAEGATEYAWDFGESGSIDSHDKTAKVSFSAPGKRTISVTVTVSGKKTRRQMEVEVSKPQIAPAPGLKVEGDNGEAFLVSRLNRLYQDFEKNSGAIDEISNKILGKDFKIPVELNKNGTVSNLSFQSYYKMIMVSTEKYQVVSAKVIKDKSGYTKKIIIKEIKR